MYIRTISALAAAAFTAATLAIATPVRAAEPGEGAISIGIADLDLGSPRDVERLDRRVRGAARQVCGWVPSQDLNLSKMVRGCQDQVVANAMADVGIAIASARPIGPQLALRRR